MVEEGAELVGGLVDAVAVLVEQRQEHLFAALAVTVLASRAGPAGQDLHGAGRGGGLVDAQLAQAVVDRAELVFSPKTTPYSSPM